MSSELFIARRIYKGDNKNNKQVSSPAVKIAIAGIALGLAVMIVAVCIIIGFKNEIRGKVIGFGSHIQITTFESNVSYEHSPIAVSDTLLNILNSNPEISHIQEFITKPGIIKTDDDFMGVVLKGVSESHSWDFFKTNLLEGDIIKPNDTTTANQAIISKSIADKLLLKIGETNFEDYDQLFIITEKNILGNLNTWDSDMASGIEVLVNDYDNLDLITQDLFFQMASYKDRLGNSLYTRSIKDINPMIFNWLDLLNMNVAVIIILMLIVSGFTMISGLLIIILERTNMIGILKSMGARDFSIRKIFLYLSAFLIGKGMLWGNIIALVFCFLQNQFKILKLDPSTYYLSAVPVDINPLYIILLNISVLIVSLLMMIAPSYLVAKITPAKSIMFE